MNKSPLKNFQPFNNRGLQGGLETSPDGIDLRIQDNGSGIPSEQSDSESMGLELIDTLATQELKGSVEFQNRRDSLGTEVVVRFPGHTEADA